MTAAVATDERIYTAFHLFCGIGGGAIGFQNARGESHGLHGRFRTLGGVDCDSLAIEDFDRLVGVKGTVLDLFTREDYEAFHGEAPPASWREATPEDIFAAAGGECPDVIFTSPPCKGLSGLLSNEKSESPKYQALNRLVVRGFFLALEAFSAPGRRLPRLVLLENVPRIAQRGRKLLDQVTAMLRAYGYAVAEGAHNCGEIGSLAQNRNRFLLVARHTSSTAPFLYQPPKHRVRAIGEVLEQLPMPDAPEAGPLHRLPRLRRETWERLALIPAGKDWKALKAIDVSRLRLVPVPGAPSNVLRIVDLDAVPEVDGAELAADGGVGQDGPRFNNVYRTATWDEPSPAVTGGAGPSSGSSAVADPRPWPPADLVVIIALDGTWHRPLTTLELAALQGLPTRMADGSPLVLAGRSMSGWRERIGNMVPPPAAQAVAESMLWTLLAHDAGMTFTFDNGPVWVRPEEAGLAA